MQVQRPVRILISSVARSITDSLSAGIEEHFSRQRGNGLSLPLRFRLYCPDHFIEGATQLLGHSLAQRGDEALLQDFWTNHRWRLAQQSGDLAMEICQEINGFG
jgi:hypothetical protein